MPTSPNEDGRPTQGGAAAPVHVMNPISVTLTGTIPGTVEIANDVGAPVPVAGTVIVGDGTNNITIQTANADGTNNTQNNMTVTSRLMGFNGTTWDRIRTVIGDAMAATGLLGFVTMLWNGATFDRWKGDNTGAARVSLYGKGTAVGDTAIDVTATGRVIVATGGATGTGADGRNIINMTAADDTTNSPIGVALHLYDPKGDGWDRARPNHEVTVLASAARTASVNSSDLTNYNARGVIVVVDITALAGGSITVAIKGKDTLSGKYSQLLASAALPGTGTTQLIVCPGITVAANLAASAPLPRLWRVEVTAADGSSITYSIGANYVG